MLKATEQTKKILQTECEEARFALKPWSIESTVVRELDRNICTCHEGQSTEARAEEIAAEIGKTVLHSQQLREKLAVNLHKERQNARKLSVQEIYSTSKRNPMKILPPTNADGKHRSASTQRTLDNNANSSTFRSSSTTRSSDKNQLRRPGIGSEDSRESVTGRRGTNGSKAKTQNFILANKMRVRSESRDRSVSRSQTNLRKISSSTKLATNGHHQETLRKSDEFDNLNELDRLIKKFAAEASVNSEELRKNCSLHATNPSGTVEERVITSVDAVEGLDRFGIPSQIVKILKIYHAYLKSQLFDEAQVTSKQLAAKNNFFSHFDRISKKTKSHHQSSDYHDLTSGFSALFKTSYEPNLTNHELKLAKSEFMTLEYLYKQCNVRETAGELEFFQSNCDDMVNELEFDVQNWMSNGVWNYLCISDLKGLFGTHCTRYSDRNQLMLFFDLVQKVQRKVYETELAEVLLQSVIPKLKELFDPYSPEFIETYKLVYAIVGIINLRVPVLAKADSDD